LGDLNQDGQIQDVETHAGAIQNIYQNSLGDIVQIERRPDMQSTDGNLSFNQIETALVDLETAVNAGDTDAVSISFGNSVDINNLLQQYGQITGQPVDLTGPVPPEVRQYLRENLPPDSQTRRMLESVDRIASKNGNKVYISTGNDQPGRVSLFSVAAGVDTGQVEIVGGYPANVNGNFIDYTQTGSTRRENGTFVLNDQGNLISNYDDLADPNSPTGVRPDAIVGTSFANVSAAVIDGFNYGTHDQYVQQIDQTDDPVMLVNIFNRLGAVNNLSPAAVAARRDKIVERMTTLGYLQAPPPASTPPVADPAAPIAADPAPTPVRTDPVAVTNPPVTVDPVATPVVAPVANPVPEPVVAPAQPQPAVAAAQGMSLSPGQMGRFQGSPNPTRPTAMSHTLLQLQFLQQQHLRRNVG
jgi:hypothetical protein